MHRPVVFGILLTKVQHDVARLERVCAAVPCQLAAKRDDVFHKVVGHVHDELGRLCLDRLSAINLLQQRPDPLQGQDLCGLGNEGGGGGIKEWK